VILNSYPSQKPSQAVPGVPVTNFRNEHEGKRRKSNLTAEWRGLRGRGDRLESLPNPSRLKRDPHYSFDFFEFVLLGLMV
jgi:hypothetical protein